MPSFQYFDNLRIFQISARTNQNDPPDTFHIQRFNQFTYSIQNRSEFEPKSVQIDEF